MRLESKQYFILTLDNGDKIELTSIGKGSFHRCYTDRNRDFVYSIPIQKKREDEQDYSKELLYHVSSRNPDNPHIPVITEIGRIAGNVPVYRMPYYRSVSRESTKAYEQWKKLNFLWNEEPEKIVRAIAELSTSVAGALQEIIDMAYNYGERWFLEFPKRNLKIDKDGNLVLLDIIYLPI